MHSVLNRPSLWVRALTLCVLAAAALAGCGGGGSADAGAPTPSSGTPPPPTISGTPATQVAAGQAYSFTPTASGPSGTTLTFSVQNPPSWAAFSTATGTVSGTPSSSNVGTFSSIVISVSDGQLSASLPAFNIQVSAAPAPAVNNFLFSVPTGATAGSPFSFTVTARDSSNSVLTGYTGTVHFYSSDPAPVLPADYTFLSTDNGTRQFAATLGTAGNQTISVNQVAGSAPVATSPAISVTSAAPPPTATRDPMKWPFAATSVWNMPIGSGATYVASGLHFTTTPNSTEYWYDMPQSDHERIVLTPTAPLTNVYISNVGWSGGDRCTATGGIFFAAPIPASYVVPNSTYNNGAAILLADGLTIVQTQPFTKCAGYSYATTMQVPSSLSIWEYNLQTGDGILGAHGGSDLSTLGGTIRLGELRPGTQMRHALKINVDSVTSLGLCSGNFNACFTWPAATADGYAANAGSGYGSATNNSNSAMKMGALLAIPASVNIGTIGLQSVPGQMLAWTLQNYGAYIVDSRSSPGFDLCIEDGTAGSKADEFQADYGFPFDGRLGYVTLTDSTGAPTPQAKWVSDIRLIIDYLSVVGNNSPTTIGGGGNPLQPLAPPFQ